MIQTNCVYFERDQSKAKQSRANQKKKPQHTTEMWNSFTGEAKRWTDFRRSASHVHIYNFCVCAFFSLNSFSSPIRCGHLFHSRYIRFYYLCAHSCVRYLYCCKCVYSRVYAFTLLTIRPTNTLIFECFMNNFGERKQKCRLLKRPFKFCSEF